MKTLLRMMVAGLGLVVAGSVWGHELPGSWPQGTNPGVMYEIDVTLTCSGRMVTFEWEADSHRWGSQDTGGHYNTVGTTAYFAVMTLFQLLPAPAIVYKHSVDGRPSTHAGSYTFQGQWGGLYRVVAGSNISLHTTASVYNPMYAEVACGDAPVVTAPPAAASCDHAAFVPIIPPGIRGVPASSNTAHWIRLTNPSDAPVRFEVTGFDDAGKRLGTYRSKLASRALTRVKVRELEAGFGDESFPSWYSLDVRASGPISVVAVWKPANTSHGRIVLPVERPVECPARLQ